MVGKDEGKNPCQNCKDYKKCPYGRGKEWYHYGEIRFCLYQILWIIEIAGTVGFYSWPPNPEGSGYIDPMIKTGYASEAYFVKPVVVLAEVETRLKRCGTDGKLLKAEVLAGLELSPESKDALMYCKGKWRKRMSYQRWLRDRRYQDKKLTKTTTNTPT